MKTTPPTGSLERMICMMRPLGSRAAVAALCAAMLLSLSVLGGCAARTPGQAASTPDAPAAQEESGASDSEESQPQEDAAAPDESESPDDTAEEEQPEEPAADPVYQIGDSGFCFTLPSPLQARIDPNMGNISLYVADDPSFLGSVTYEQSDIALDQLKQGMVSLEEGGDGDSTVSNFQMEPVKLDNGDFTLTISYSDGDTDTSAGGFFYSFYRKAGDGLITFMIRTPRVDYDEAVRQLFTTVQEDTGDAQPVPES